STVSRRVSLTLSSCGIPRTTMPLVARLLANLPLFQARLLWVGMNLQAPATWSRGERDVAYFALLGLEVERIRELRQSSLPTVRSQLRTAARKAGSVDRFELGASESLRFSWHPLEKPPQVAERDAGPVSELEVAG